MVSRARLPAKTIRSAQEMLRPYFFFTGHSSRRALSRLRLSGQLFSGAKRSVPEVGPPRPSRMWYVPAPRHTIRRTSGP